MKFNIKNIFSNNPLGNILKQVLFIICMAGAILSFSDVNATINVPTFQHQSFGDYVPGGLVYVQARIDGLSNQVSALGIQINIPEGLTYEKQSVSELWINEKITENGVELVLSKVPEDNQVQFHYLLHASPQLQGKQTITATMFYRMGDTAEERFSASPMTIDEVDINGFHHVSECLDNNTSKIENTLYYQGNITALGVRLLVANNTQFFASQESNYDIKELDESTIQLFWKEPPASPVKFSYVLKRTGVISADANIKTQLVYRIDDGVEALKNLYPDPIHFPQCEQFTIKATSSEGGIIKPEGLITVNRGDSKTFSMETHEGFLFRGWLVDGEMQYDSPLKEYVFNNIRADHRITAMFKQIEYQIQIDKDVNGTILSSTGSDTVLHGNNITFTIIPNTGYEIDRILKNTIKIETPQDGKVTFENVTNNQQELAIFFKPKKYEIILDFNPDKGLVSPTDGDNFVHHGQNKTFSFRPYAGYVVGEVRIDNQPVTILNSFYMFRNVTKSHTLTVSFVPPEKYTITTHIEGNGKIEPAGDIVVDRGQSPSFTFIPDSGNIVEDIVIDDISKGPLKTYVFSFITQSHSVTAIFDSKPTFTIEASVNNDECGTIEPSGAISVKQGENQTFLINPSDSCVIQDVLVNNVSMGKVKVHTFWNVQQGSSIKVLFRDVPSTKYKVDITHNEGGTVQPSGVLTANEGDILNIKPKPDTGFQLKNVIANNEIVNSPYRIEINQAYTIVVNFEPDDDYMPVADFAATQISLVDPLSVSFEDKSQGLINQWEWDFGDGFKIKAQDTIHVYQSSGKYTVSLAVSGPIGSDTIQKDIQVIKETPPQIDVAFISTNTTGPVPFEVPFINLSRYPDNVTPSWLWDFGDGNTSPSGAKKLTHVYTKAGIYTVTLTANTANESYSEQKQNYIKIDGRKIQGRVTKGDINGNDTNAAYAGCTVEVHIRSKATQYPLFVDSVLTDQNGQYTITGLPASDKLIVSAWPPFNENQYMGEYYKDQSTPFTANLITTKTSDQVIPFVLTKVPELGIKGQVTRNGAGLSNIEVSVLSMSNFYFQTTSSDGNGYYTFTHLSNADDYRVYAWSDAHNAEVYYYLPKDKTVGEDIPDSSVFSWDRARPVKPQDGYIDNINILMDTSSIGNIRGIVRLKENGLPISDIWVNAWSEKLNSGNGAMTDQSGAYTIVGLEQSDNKEDGYIVEIDSSDTLFPYQAYNQADTRKSADLVLPDANDINFYLKKGNTIFGHVYNKDGNPLKDVKITTWSLSKGTSNDTMSDETGLYSIPNMPPADDYVVSAFSQDYPIQYFYHKNKQKNADHVDLTGGNVYNIDFHLDKGAVIEGTVHQSPEEGVFINAWSPSDERLHTEKTDSNGNYRFIGLNAHAADYIIYVWEEDYLRAFYSATGTVHSWKDATGVEPGSIVSPCICDITLSKGISIQGKVNAGNHPVADVKVEVWTLSDEFIADDVSTDDLSQGYNYKLTGIPGGATYKIRFIHDQYKEEVIEITADAVDILDAHCDLKLPERILSGLIYNLAPGKTVFVKVSRKNTLDIRMKPIVGTDSEYPYEVPYRFNDLKPLNNYIVDIIPTAHYPYVSHEDIDLRAGDQTEIHLTLATDTRTINGKITFPDNATVGDIVWVYAWSVKLKSENQTEIVFDGNKDVPYEITGLNPSKDYIVSIDSNVYKQQFYDNTTSFRLATRIDLTQDQENIDFILQKGASISGNVVNKDGEPLEGIRVEAWSESKKHMGFINTDSNGYYEMGGLKITDDYVVYILYHQSIFYYNTDGLVSNMHRATPISTNQLAEKIDFKLVETGIISGIVRDSNNKRLENVIVTARSESTGANNGCITDKKGRYTIYGLPLNDDYLVTATPDSDTNYMTQVKRDIPTDSIHVNFSLVTGYAIAGIVKSWTGDPVPDAKVELVSNNVIEPPPCFTGEDGQFLIGGIPEGAYYFLVMPPDNAELIDYFEKNVVIDDNIVGKTVSLRPASQINGTVTLAGSVIHTPLSDIMITLFSETHSYWTYAITDQAGYYQFNNIPEANDYVIKNVSDNYLSHVELNRASGETVDFSLETAVVLKGMIINAQTGQGIEDARIEIRYQGIIRDETRTDSNGQFQATSLESIINGNVAEYIVVAKYSGYPDVQAQWSADDSDLLVLKMSRGAQNIISGLVTDTNGEIPSDDVDVYVQYYYQQTRKGYLGTIKCDSDGSFAIHGLNPDRDYHLKIVARKNKDKKKFWVGTDYAPVSKRRDAKAVSTGQNAFTIKINVNSAW